MIALVLGLGWCVAVVGLGYLVTRPLARKIGSRI